jgi:hypothetical protein
MANNLYLSAGVYNREFDLSFYPGQTIAPGLAVIGPTVRGPAMVPTLISTYSEYLRWFGDVFSSGSGASMREYKYLTSYAVQEYLRWGETVLVTKILAGTYNPAYARVKASNTPSGSVTVGDMSFELISLTDGDITNSGTLLGATQGSGDTVDENSVYGILASGSKYNMRWEVANVDSNRGTFDLYIRRGDDSNTRKVILEQFVGVSLDPTTSNFITKVIGDQTYSLRYDSSGAPYLQLTGSMPNRSRFVRAIVHKTTLNYLNDSGLIRDNALSGSLPVACSGTFGGGSDGNVAHPRAMYQNIWNLNTQGFNMASASYGKTAYEDAIDILSNRDQFDFDLIATPGLIDNLEDHAKIITRAISMVEDRGDAFYIIDPTYFGSTVGQARAAAEARNSNYGGYYYPWVQVNDPDLGDYVWTPPSAMVAGVFAFNDYFGQKWFAPAGLNRGVLDTVIQTERVMTQNDRDNLYIKSVNPIASFPKEGIVVWGQKTLQKKRSALDRINVRRLLIAAKRHVANTVKYLVFEQNTSETWTKYLNLTRPWFDDCKRKQGLYDFKIIIDERNNTPEVVDRNEMRAQIYLKPAKTAEFIITDFIITPTSAAFPADATAKK